MDPQDFDPFNVAAWSQVQHAASEEPQTGQTGQDAFEQHLAEASTAAPVPSRRPKGYPDLPPEDRELIDSVIAQYADQTKAKPDTVRTYTHALFQLVDHLRARGQTTELTDYEAMLNHVNTYFPKNLKMKAGLRVLAGTDPLYPHLSTGDRNLVDSMIAQYADRTKAKPGTVRTYTQALFRLVDHLRARDQTTELTDYEAMLNHVNTYFPKNLKMKAGLSVLAGAGPVHPYLSPEDRTLIDIVIAQYADQTKAKPATLKAYSWALRNLANDLRARDQTTELTDYEAMLNHANTYFPNDRHMKAMLRVLAGTRAVHSHLSPEDRKLIDSVIAQYVAQKSPPSNTVKVYSWALRHLANDLRARGQTTGLADHKSLLDHVNTYFPNNVHVNAGVRLVLAYHGIDPDYPYLSPEDRDLIDRVISRYAAQNKLAPATVQTYTRALCNLADDLGARGQTMGLADHKSLLDHVNTYFPNNVHVNAGVSLLLASINHEHDTAGSRAAKRPRTLNNLEEIEIYRQPSANSASGSEAPQAASTGLIIRGDSDGRPLYSEDAAVLGLEHALIQGGMDSKAAHEHVNRLVGFSRWLFENNRPSIVARLDSKSLSDDDATHKYIEGSNTSLLKAIEYFRTFRATGGLVVRAGRPSAKRNHSSQNVMLINPERAVLMEPRRIDDAAAQHSASHEASPRIEELQEEQDGQHAPSAFIQAQAAFHSEELPHRELGRLEKQLHGERHGPGDNRPALSFSIDTFDPELFSPEELRRLFDDEPAEELQDWLDDHPAPSPFQAQAAFQSEQLPQGELRRVLDHPDDQAMPSSASVAPEELERLEKQLLDELQGRRDNQPALSFPIDPEDLTFDPELFSPEELRRLLDDEPAEELQERRDDHPAPSPFQAQAAFQSEQLPQGELRRVLDHPDDQAMPSSASVAPEELERLEKQLHDELHGLGGNQPALSFSIDPEDLTFDLDQFPPGELRRLLDDEPAEKLQAAFHSEQLPQGELERVLDHLDDQAMPSAVSDPSEELQEWRDDHPPV